MHALAQASTRMEAVEAIRDELAGLAEKVEGLKAENALLRESVRQLKVRLEEEEDGRRDATDWLEEEVEALVGKVERLGSDSETLEAVCFPRPPFAFTLENFEHHKRRGLRWRSPAFYSHPAGYKMCLGVAAGGDSVGSGTHVSLTVHLLPGEADDELAWPFRGAVTVRLLNERREGGGHRERSVVFDEETPTVNSGRSEPGEESTGWGDPLFVSHSDLNYDPTTDTEYLKFDRLRFLVSKVTIS